jgi:hypothetical protein
MFKDSETVSSSDANTALATRHKHLGERALHLRIVEEFLTQIEFTLLKGPAEQFDFEPVKASITELRAMADDLNPDRRKRIEFQLAHELLRWQEHLAARDNTIEAYHIRRYCDGLRKPLDPEVFVALARFYRDIPRSRNSLSKFDLALTRAFSTQVSDLFRAMTMKREEVAARLASLYCSWDRVVSVEPGSTRDVVVFEKFLEESDSMLDFRSLTSSRLFDRIREFKSELGNRFWDPSVAAAAVECNIVVGNHLNGLMARASENLGERLGSEFDFAGAFQDTSPNTGTYISEALKQIDESGSLVTADTESDDIKFLRSMLELTDSINSDAYSDPAAGGSELDGTLSIETPQFLAVLALLSQRNPPTKEIVAQVETCEFQNFDVDEFLFGEDQSADTLGREVLGLILSLESLRSHELHERKVLPTLVRNKVMQLLAQAEEFGNKLELSTLEFPASAGRRLKIANKLLETRLRTERSVFKFTSRGLGMLPAPKPEGELTTSILSRVEFGRLSANRWVVGATVAALIISGILYFATGGTEASVAQDVEILEPAKLPGGEQLTGAHRQANTLYVVASDSWRDGSSEEKTEKLKALMDTQAKEQIRSVLVMDGQGQHLAEMSEKGATISPNTQ